MAPSHLGADHLGGDVLGGAMQPASEDGMLSEWSGLLRQPHKSGLRHVAGQMRVANDAHRDGMHRVHVTAHELRKGSLRAAFGVIVQKLLVSFPVHSACSSRRRGNRTGKVMASSNGPPPLLRLLPGL